MKIGVAVFALRQFFEKPFFFFQKTRFYDYPCENFEKLRVVSCSAENFTSIICLRHFFPINLEFFEENKENEN